MISSHLIAVPRRSGILAITSRVVLGRFESRARGGEEEGEGEGFGGGLLLLLEAVVFVHDWVGVGEAGHFGGFGDWVREVCWVMCGLECVEVEGVGCGNGDRDGDDGGDDSGRFLMGSL